MRKREAEAEFKARHLPAIIASEYAGIDGPKRSFAWAVYIDGLCKDGQITISQYERWAQPRWLYTATNRY